MQLLPNFVLKHKQLSSVGFTMEWVSDRQGKKSKMRPGSDEKFHGIKESSTPSSIFNLFLCPRSLNHSRPLPKWQERRCWLIGQKTKHLFLPLATIYIYKVNEFTWTHLNLPNSYSCWFPCQTWYLSGPWDRRSCKIFPNCVKFWGNNANSLGNYRAIYALNE